MTVCYPLTVQPDYTELKYSLRSIEKYLTPPFEVVIIGDKLPEWIAGITQIELPDIKGRKQLSIRTKILAALEYSQEILFMNDDVYLLKPTNEFPYYWHGMLKNYSESGSKPLLKELETMKKPVKHFDGHFPLVYDGNFKIASTNFSSEVIIKSMYCNYMEIDGTFIPDCKLQKAMKPEQVQEFIKDKHCFSTSPYSLSSALPVLKELFSQQSKYEI